MGDIEKKIPEETKKAEVLTDELAEKVAGGDGPAPEGEDDGVTYYNGAILLPEVP